MDAQQEAVVCPQCELAVESAYCPRCGIPVNAPLPASRSVVQFTAVNNILVALLVVTAVFAVAYRFNEHEKLMQTYATFVGLPLLIGVLTAYLVRPQSGLGATLKITTVILCAVCPLLGEGSVCVLMAAPIFYAFAAVGYLLVSAIMKVAAPTAQRNTRLYCFSAVLAPFVAAGFTSGPGGIQNPRTMTVRNEIRVAAPPDTVWRTLFQDNLVSPDVPSFFRLGFPLPRKLERKRGGIVNLAFDPGSEPWPGTNVIISRQLVDPGRRRLSFIIQSDGTKLARWMTFKQSTFEVIPTGGGSLLRQTTTFQQRMQPGVYWNPLQSFAVGQMHNYALSTVKQLAERG